MMLSGMQNYSKQGHHFASLMVGWLLVSFFVFFVKILSENCASYPLNVLDKFPS